MPRDSSIKGRRATSSISFPPVTYLDHGFSLLPHPTTADLLCVGRAGIAVTNEHEGDWLMARRLGVTASGFGDLVTRAGTPSKSRAKAVKSKVLGIERDIGYIQAIELGNTYEELIAERVDKEFGVAANHWLVAEAEVPRFLATPDGLSLDFVAEYKTSIKSWGRNLHTYYRQIQWQLSVTNRQQAVFAVLHPYTKTFMAGIIPRDEAEIDLLRTVASEVLRELDSYGASEEARLALEVSKFTLAPAPRNRKLETPVERDWLEDEWSPGDEDTLPF